MTEQELNELIGHSVNDPAVKEALVTLVTDLGSRARYYEKCLQLLESAIKHDYDSILITELNLDSPGPQIVYVNNGFTRMTGYTREEVIGKTPRILQGAKTDRAVLDRLKESLKKGQCFFGQTVNYRKDGSEFINQWDIHPLTDENGNITHWVSYQHDITERKRSELTLLDPEIDWDDLYENSKSTFVDLSVEGAILGANKSFRDLVGYTNEELVSMKLWDLMPRKHSSALKDEFGKMVSGDGRPTYTLMLRNKSSQLIQIQMDVRPLKLPGEKRFRGTVQNLTLRKRVLQTLKRRNNGFINIFDRKVDFNSALILDKKGEPHFKWLSDSFRKVTGYGADECLNDEGLRKVIHPNDFNKLKLHLKSAFQGRSSCIQYRIRTKDGEIKNVLDYAKPDQTSPDGSIQSVRTSCIDITGREHHTAV